MYTSRQFKADEPRRATAVHISVEQGLMGPRLRCKSYRGGQLLDDVKFYEPSTLGRFLSILEYEEPKTGSIMAEAL